MQTLAKHLEKKQIVTQRYQLLEPSLSSLKQKIEILKKINRKYVTALKQFDSKVSICLYKVKLANNVEYLLFWMCTDLKYVKQGFPEILTVFEK